MPDLPILLILALFIGFLVVTGSFFTVKQQSMVILERLGRFTSIRGPGFHFKIPFIDKVAGRMSLKVKQLDVNVETKTKDNVFVKLKVSVQYVVGRDSVYDAFYKLDRPDEQINSYIFDVVRAEVPKMILDDVFVRKDDIANAIKGELQDAMQNYGYNIVRALVTDIDPDATVKSAMNRINAAEREKLAAEYEGESERIRIVAKAKAEAESKRLQGQGIADQRREIAKGLEESVDILNSVGINSQEASALIVVTQHYDTLQSMGENVNSNLIMLPNAPTAGSDMLSQMTASFIASQQMGEEMKSSSDALKAAKNKEKIKLQR
ncbi:SPFH domain-containing protein [Lewinella sp. 4G2]|uniref:SPFH domain-containing protein n=1 Tax=Lewinella sp. 4G2 TaxID=1803372 RepID=UPI0007B4E419|nr:SPFH domain-containing protein [Lewinella sp. 4G2]OAV45259.1 protease [Lewinella sp. 4G2]